VRRAYSVELVGPERLPDTVNISERMHNPSIAANSDLYFTSPRTRPGQVLTWGLYRAAYRNGRYDSAQPLSFRDGDVLDADDPAIAPDRSYLIFGSHGLHAPLGQGHLFIAFRSERNAESTCKITTILQRAKSGE
jgi:hypothetical protein